jgi:hypothetical protein
LIVGTSEVRARRITGRLAAGSLPALTGAEYRLAPRRDVQKRAITASRLTTDILLPCRGSLKQVR